jgi:nitroimidazol reductase NimA-like FMN-containing flavoprotein (pyridoxamine 5'-phosphate oxidase superfamily)
MRKANREITDKAEILAVMEEALVCRIGLSDDGMPYVVPMNYGLGENSLYLHCATEGRKLEILRRNDRVCFEMDLLREVKRVETGCGCTASFESVIGFGRAAVVTDAAERRRGLDRIMEHYRAKGPFAYTEENLTRTAVLRIDIESVTGKRHE